MKIICAGLSKTGTKTMSAALRVLGFTVHDYLEHMEYTICEYIKAHETGITPDFTTMYSKVDAVTDFPACFFWKEIKESFPEAKVILMERDNAESWLSSMLNLEADFHHQMSKKTWLPLATFITPTGRTWKKHDVLFNVLYNSFEKENKEKRMIQVYNEHNSRVKASIPRDEFLVFNVKQGWKPLCEFLGVDVPDVPFPQLNVSNHLVPRLHDVPLARAFKELIVVVATIVVIFSVLIFTMFF